MPANIPRFSYPYTAMNFMTAMAIRILIANSWTRWRGIFNGLSQDGGKMDLSKTLRNSFFNEYISNEPNFSQIHLPGQYL